MRQQFQAWPRNLNSQQLKRVFKKLEETDFAKHRDKTIGKKWTL